MYNLRKDYVGLEKVGNELLAQPGVSESSSASQIRNILERASFKSGEELESKNDYLGSAKKFDAFAKKYPNSSILLKAQFNAGINYQKANRAWPAIGAFELVLKSKEKEAIPLQDKIIKILPKMYQEMGMYQRAATSYAIAADKNPDVKDSVGYIYNAAFLFDALNTVDKALKYYEIYLKKAQASERSDIFYRMADLTYRNKLYHRAIDYYREFIHLGRDPELIVESHFNTADCYFNLRNNSEWANWRNKVVAVQQSLVPKLRGPGAHFAAQIRLQNIEQVYKQLTSLKFPAESAKIKKIADQKLNLINKINLELTEVVKYDSAEEIVGSLELLGRTNAHMSDALLKAPLPPEVIKDNNTKQQYINAVSDMAKPFLAKAIESYRGAITKGKDLETYSSSYFVSINSLYVLDPNFKLDNGQEAIVKTNRTTIRHKMAFHWTSSNK